MFKNNLAYEASAGSGKTFMLVVRYLSLLFQGAEPSKILALTFTNKAAREMSERVIQTLEELESRGEFEEIIKVTELSREHILSRRQKILNEFLNANTKIMTIDSFFTQILRKFSLYASLMPDFSTFSSQHELKLMSRFLKEVSVAGKRNTLINLSLESKKRLGDIFMLLDEFYTKKEELSHLKFSKQESHHVEAKAMEALGGLQALVSNCKGASPTLIKAVQAENFDALREKTWVVKESLEYWVFKKCFSLEMNAYLHTIQESLKEYYDIKEQNFFYGLSELVAIYVKSKKALYQEDSELSFSDVTSLVYEILHFLHDSEFLYFRLDAQIEHMLLDEFQDTSILQYEILKPLISEITAGNGIFENGSFFFVGDVKQSIYRFRGGVSALFGEVVEQNATQVEQLLTNYRSQKEVIEFVNRVFKDKIKNYSPQLVRAEAQGGYVEVLESDAPLEETVNQVKKLIALGANVDDIAILCATNGDGEMIKNQLQEQGIEVVTETTTKLINQRSVGAIIEYLKYLYFNEEIYKRNFFALIEQEPRAIAKVDLNNRSLVDIVKRAIDEFKLFNDSFHLIRFVSTIANYPDIESFIFEYERLDTEAAASDISGVRVLTVHKSKGLEYDHVIVMDRLKKAPPARDAIIYDYDGISLQNIYLRTKGRGELDSAYANALDKEKQLVYEDSLNALYVAFTRAKQSLMIVRKPKDSSFELLDLELCSYGALELQVQERKQTALQEKSFEYQSFYYGTQSDILALEKEDEEDFSAINFGLALHYTLEMIGEFHIDKLPNAKAMVINKFGYSMSETELHDIESRVTQLLHDNSFKKLIQGECFREKALRYNNNLRYIDLLVKREDGGWNIIDYKSSTAYSKHHVVQVAYYVKAVKEITGDAVDGYLCYLLEDEVKILKVA